MRVSSKIIEILTLIMLISQGTALGKNKHLSQMEPKVRLFDLWGSSWLAVREVKYLGINILIFVSLFVAVLYCIYTIYICPQVVL